MPPEPSVGERRPPQGSSRSPRDTREFTTSLGPAMVHRLQNDVSPKDEGPRRRSKVVHDSYLTFPKQIESLQIKGRPL